VWGREIKLKESRSPDGKKASLLKEAGPTKRESDRLRKKWGETVGGSQRAVFREVFLQRTPSEKWEFLKKTRALHERKYVSLVKRGKKRVSLRRAREKISGRGRLKTVQVNYNGPKISFSPGWDEKQGKKETFGAATAKKTQVEKKFQ